MASLRSGRIECLRNLLRNPGRCGHADAPVARRIAENLRLPWAKVLALALMPPASRSIAFGRMLRERNPASPTRAASAGRGAPIPAELKEGRRAKGLRSQAVLRRRPSAACTESIGSLRSTARLHARAPSRRSRSGWRATRAPSARDAWRSRPPPQRGRPTSPALAAHPAVRLPHDPRNRRPLRSERRDDLAIGRPLCERSGFPSGLAALGLVSFCG